MALVYHSDAGFDDSAVVWFEVDAGNLKIHLRDGGNPLVVPMSSGKGQAMLAYLQSKGTLVKPPAPAPKP